MSKVEAPNWLVYVAIVAAVLVVAFFGWKSMTASDQAGADLERSYMKQPRLLDGNGNPIKPSDSKGG